MKRFLEIVLVLVMVVCFTGTAFASEGWVYTYHDAAQTQIKTAVYYDADGIARTLLEYPVAGDLSVYTEKNFDYGDGQLSSESSFLIDKENDVGTFSYRYYGEDTGRVRDYSTDLYHLGEGGSWERFSSEWNSYDVAGRLIWSETDDLHGNIVYREFSYNKDDEVIERTVSTRKTDLETGSYTEQTLVSDAKGKVLEQKDSAYAPEQDAQGDFLGGKLNQITQFFDAAGALVKTETFSQERDKADRDTGEERTVLNAQDITTSSVESTRAFADEFPDELRSFSDKSSLFDGQTGSVLASIQIKGEKEFEDYGGIKSEKRTSVNQDGTLIASYVYENKGQDGSIAKTEYFHEDTGKIRKSVDKVVSYDEQGNYMSSTTTKNAAGILTEVLEEMYAPDASGDQWLTETRKYDSVTGALKSTTATKDVFGKSNETSVKNAAGVMLSKRVNTQSLDDDGFDITESQISKYNAQTGALEGQYSEIYKSKYDDETGSWFESRTQYDEKGNKREESEYGPLLDAEGEQIGTFSYNARFGESGEVSWSSRTEDKVLRDDDGNYIGNVSVTKNKDGVITYKTEYKELFDERGIYLGSTMLSTSYNDDGTVCNKYEETYDADTKTTKAVETNGKGTVLRRMSDVADYLGRTRVTEDYSSFTGNLMTTTTVKTKEDHTGAHEENERRVKANGLVERISDISYMYVDAYGYMNYLNNYTNYLYRWDGSLKYTIQGKGLIDNYYFDLFMEQGWGADPEPMEILESTTAASGILTREYHMKKDLEENGLWASDYTKETKVYDEKTGALQSITTETQDYDPVTGKSVFHSLTVDPQGKRMEERTEQFEEDVYGNYLDIGFEHVAFNRQGSQILDYASSGEGGSEITRKTFDLTTGNLLILETGKRGEGNSSTEILTYDAAGNVIRRETSKYTFDGDGSTYVWEAFNAVGALLSRTSEKQTTRKDGSIVDRSDSVDAAGRATYWEQAYTLDDYGNMTSSGTTWTYYDDNDQLMKSVSEGGKTVTYNAASQVVSIETWDEYGNFRMTDAAGNLLSYGVVSDTGDVSEYFANGKPKLIFARDDDGELRKTSYDNEGYINYVSIQKPDQPYTMYYDGNGKVSEIFYRDGDGRTAYYNAADKQWYRGTGDDKTAIGVPDFAEGIDMSDIETGGRAKPRGSWYPNNTVCTFGIHLRDIKPELTGKWYTVTPIDLSQDGTQSFEMVGGNMWIIGQVNVTVEGDNVTVTYDIIKDGYGRTTVKSEYFNLFNHLDSMTEEALEGDSKDGKGYQYGQPISIDKDLGGDTNVLLYVRNVATFNTRVYGDQFLVRMWENLPERMERRTAMEDLMAMDTVPAVDASGN